MEPYPHVTVSNVFIPEFYSVLSSAYVDYVKEIFFKFKTAKKELKPYGETDTYIFRINHLSPSGLHVFMSNEWHVKLSSLFEIPFTKDINIAVHYHDKGSKNGSIHNDLNPGWFIETNNDEINIADTMKCDYKTGELKVEGIRAKQTIRSLAMIFYLNNPNTADMSGGSTGLYKSAQQLIEEPSLAIAPDNNSMLIFPCTPYSYHAFLSNKSHQRCSVIMWLHSSVDYMKLEYGENEILNWIM
jgi:hypothetical protein